MRPSSSASEPGLFGAATERGSAASEVSDLAWLTAMLEVESAIAVAAADAGLVDAAVASTVVAACADPTAYNLDDIGRRAAETGTPVLPLVEGIRAAVGPEAADGVHVGATSQDVIDTAMMLVARRGVAAIVGDVRRAADAAAALALVHRDTPMAGRTLLQQALPVTFGLKAAGWTAGLDGAAERLVAVAGSLPLQYGGAAGTLAASGGAGAAMVGSMARTLSLRAPVVPWHTVRLPVADLAGALGTAAGVVSKVATDLVLLAQTEVGEVTDATPGRGGSSAMAHKANPVAAVSARACARRAPGLVATLLASMEQEHERAAGAWHAEWTTLAHLVVAVGSAAAWLDDALEHVEVHVDRMAANLSAPLAGAATGEAGRMVDAVLAARPAPGGER